MPTTKSFTATVVQDASAAIIPVPFDPKEVFGQVRAPVVVTVDGYTFRTRVVAMGGPVCVALRKAQVEESGLTPGQTVSVTLALDTAPRTVTAPADLMRALKKAPAALAAWQALAFTHQREHVEAIEGAKKPETRARRIEKALAFLAARPARKAPAKTIAKKR
jgi:hypothetical protein